MTSSDAIRTSQRRTWAGLSAAWERWDGVIMAQMAPVTDAMVGALDLRPGQRHLDVAAGTGEPGLTVAASVPGARVVLTDLSEAMLGVASRRAAERGLTDVAVEVCSADALPLENGAVDSVTVRFGLMFLPDPAAALREVARVLRPGGRVCASVWAEPAENPWTTVLAEAVATEVPLPPPDPDGPGMYRFATPGRVPELFRAAGLHDVEEWDVGVELVTRSPEEYWQVMSEHVSLAAAALGRVDEAGRRRMADAAVEGVRRHVQDGRVSVPGLARCTVGTRR